jgi:hypothetical protein
MSDFHDEHDDKDPFSRKGISDWVKKTIGNNVGADSLLSILAQADKTKKDLMHVLSREMRGFLDSIEMSDLLTKILSNATLEVSARIRLVPSKDGGLQIKMVGRDKPRAEEAEAMPKAKVVKKKRTPRRSKG